MRGTDPFIAYEPNFYGAALVDGGKIIALSGYPPTAWRLNADGSFDSTFPGFRILGHSGLAGYRAAIQSSGPVAYVYGNFFSINGAVVHGFGRILLAPARTGMDIQAVDTDSCTCSAYLRLVAENEGPLAVKVRRLGESTGPATISYSTLDGTAKAGRDYVLTSGILSFAPLEVEKIVTVPILDNAALDGRRTLQLYLTNAVGADFIAPPVTMTIVDDEPGFEPGMVTRLPDGSMRIIVQAAWFTPLYLEVSSQLKEWTRLTTVGQNYLSPFETEMIDTDAGHFPRRFYRVAYRVNRYGIRTNSSFLVSFWESGARTFTRTPHPTTPEPPEHIVNAKLTEVWSIAAAPAQQLADKYQVAVPPEVEAFEKSSRGIGNGLKRRLARSARAMQCEPQSETRGA